ncbi:MAG: prolyl oligopeptidase family serine peptidase [Candidatus Wallbacteria bacterium]|nr:prolyl oligopeptidase family serine peptidase [Candidatus Wallbacteria bacterium]
MADKKSNVPVSRKINVRDLLHGKALIDPYRWLEDQQSPDTREWLDRQTEYARKLLDSHPDHKAMKRKFLSLRNFESTDIPHYKNGYYYYMKRQKGKNLSMIFRRLGLQGTEELLIDPNGMSRDGSVSVGFFRLSPDGKILIHDKRTGGADESALHFYDLKAGREILKPMPVDNYHGFALSRGNKGIYYSSKNKKGIFFHVFGQDHSRDVKIFGQGYNSQWIIGCWNPEKSDYLLIAAFHGSSGTKSEVFLKKMDLESPVVPIIKGIEAGFQPDLQNGLLYVLTNWKAPRNRLLVIDPAKPGRKHWKELIPESENTLNGVEIAGNLMIAGYQQNVSSRLCVFDLNGSYRKDLELPGIGTVFNFRAVKEKKELFFGFSSFTSPYTIYRCDFKFSAPEIWASPSLKIDRKNIEVRQVFYPSQDGTEIPMYLVHKKGLKLNGKNPVLLYGYGGFNHSLSPFFSPHAVFWTELGGIYAVANLRGGGEFGEDWHRAGMLEKKQNVFDDFHSAAEWLINNKYTNPGKLAIYGGSNGGLLVGAALTQRPELFGAVVCTYPLLDMIRYHKFLSGSYWITEYGSSDNLAQFKYILKYSPYHNLKKGRRYPPVMFITGDMDTRVDPCHARKMTALLQECTGSGKPVILRYDTKAGHVRGQSVKNEAAVDADTFSFLLQMLGSSIR